MLCLVEHHQHADGLRLHLEVQNPYPPVDRLLYSFSSAEDLAHWNVFTDQQYGGQSTAKLVLSGDELVRPLSTTSACGLLLPCGRPSSLMHAPESTPEACLYAVQGTAEFRGNISTDMHADTGEGKRMQRSGFAGINTEVCIAPGMLAA